MIKRFLNQPRKQLVMSLFASAAAIVAFGLFFAYGVSDEGGDGLRAFQIAFYVTQDGLRFNPSVFLGYVLPLFTVIAVLIPFRDKRAYIAPAVIFFACGVMTEFSLQAYLSVFSEETAQMIKQSGTALADAAIISGWLDFLAAALCAAKVLSKLPPLPEKKVRASACAESNAPAENADDLSEKQEDLASAQSEIADGAQNTASDDLTSDAAVLSDETSATDSDTDGDIKEK